MYFLGLSALSHNPAAALLGDSGFEAAIEESKLERTRSAAGIPRLAIHFCLKNTGIRWQDLRAVAVASQPWKSWARRSWLRTRSLPTAPISTGYYQSKILGELARELNNLRILRLLGGNPNVRVLSFDHHLCHAASAFYASPFDHALILTLDEQGDGLAGIVARGEGERIRPLQSIPFPHSIAWVYSQLTELLGYRPHEQEHKTQWLSLTTDPEYGDLFLRMLRRSSGGPPHLDRHFFRRGLVGRLAFSDYFYQRIGVSTSFPAQMDAEQRAKLASSLQFACNAVIVDWAEALRRRQRVDNLCLAGGLFLNSLLVAAVETNTGFKQVFVQPAAGNEGTSLGAAWLARHQAEGKWRKESLPHLYLGPSYSNEEIKQVLDNCKAAYRWIATEAEKVEEALRLLQAGKIVTWFQEAAEFGPRALGNRSLLASPWAPYVTENLNDYVKHRESFRPFALSVPEDDAGKYFDFSTTARFIAGMGSVRPESRELLSKYILPGNRARLHVVSRDANPLYWSLLRRFGQLAPAPILLNTSFNLFGEPLVITPRDAVRSYFCSGTDAMIIGSFLLSKS